MDTGAWNDTESLHSMDEVQSAGDSRLSPLFGPADRRTKEARKLRLGGKGKHPLKCLNCRSSGKQKVSLLLFRFDESVYFQILTHHVNVV
jgi:hypothetical protein